MYKQLSLFGARVDCTDAFSFVLKSIDYIKPCQYLMLVWASETAVVQDMFKTGSLDFLVLFHLGHTSRTR